MKCEAAAMRRNPSSVLIYWTLAGLVALLVFVVALSRPWGLFCDYWPVAATVREAAAHPFNPSDPLLANVPSSAAVRFTPYTLILGLIHRYTGLSLVTVMALAGAVNVLLLAGGLYLLTTALFPGRWMPVWALVCHLVVWGPIVGWANEPSLGGLVVTACYWGTFAFAVVLLGLYCTVIFIRRGSLKAWWGYLLLMAIGTIVHTLTTSWGMVVATVMALSLAGASLKRFLGLLGSNVLALCTPFVWPYFAFGQYIQYVPKIVEGPVILIGTTTNRQAASSSNPRPRRAPPSLAVWGTVAFVALAGIIALFCRAPDHEELYHIRLKSLGPALLGVPAAVYFALRGKHLWLFWSLAATLLCYFLGMFVNFWVFGRYIMYAGFLMQLAIAAWVYLELPGYLQRAGWQGLTLFAIVVLALGTGVRYRKNDLMVHIQRVVTLHPLSVDFRSTAPVARYDWLAHHLHEGDVVLAQGLVGFPLPALTGCRVMEVLRPEQRGVDHQQRRRDVERFLQEPLSDVELEGIIHKYNATHVLLDEKVTPQLRPKLKKQLERLCRLVDTRDGVSLYATAINRN